MGDEDGQAALAAVLPVLADQIAVQAVQLGEGVVGQVVEQVLGVDGGALPGEVAVHLVFRYQIVRRDAVDDQPERQGQGEGGAAEGEVRPADFMEGGQQEQGHHRHAPVGHQPLEAEAVGRHVQCHPPAGGGQQHQTLRRQHGGEEAEDFPGLALPAGEGEGGQQYRQIQDGDAHHLEEAASRPVGVGDAPGGQVVRPTEQPRRLHRQKQEVQHVQSRQHHHEQQTVGPGGFFGGGAGQRLGAAEADQQAEHERRQHQAPEELPQGGGEMLLDERPQVRRGGGEQGVRRG